MRKQMLGSVALFAAHAAYAQLPSPQFQDVSVQGMLNVTGATNMTGKLTTEQSNTTNSGLNLPPGTAPSGPIDGDVWMTASALFARIAGATVQIGNGPGSGTVTTVSVANANGMNGTVANPTSTPAISLFPTFSGLAKATSGTGFAAATANTDYLTPTGPGGGLTGLSYSQLPAIAANSVLGALTSTTPSALPMTACTTSASALTWTPGTGFGCHAVSSAPSGVTGSIQFNNSGVLGGLPLGTSTQLLHGNVSGTASFSAVSLTTDVTGNLPNANLATQTANTVLGALTGTTPSGLPLPSCSSASSALTYALATGFGCNSIIGGAAATFTDGTHSVASVTTATFSPGFLISGTTGSVTVSPTAGDNTHVASYSIQAADMGAQTNFSASALATVSITAITSTVFAAGMQNVITNQGTNNLNISSTVTINGFSGTVIPPNGGMGCTSNGTSLDCIALGNVPNVPSLSVAQSWTAPQRSNFTTPAISTLTYTPVFSSSQNFRINLSTSCTAGCIIANPAAIVAGQDGTFEIAQSASGGDTVSWGSNFVAAGGTSAISLGTASSTVTFISYHVDSAASVIVLGAPIKAPAH